MKKHLLSVLVCLFACQVIKAQTWQEWFQQKKTQKQYLLQQIAALQVFFNYAKKGYTIAGKGINMIYQVKNGDFTLHSHHFGSLKLVNPAINKYSKIAAIIDLQVQILNRSKQAMQTVLKSQHYSTAEITHCRLTFENLLTESSKSMDALIDVIGNDLLKFSDDERIQRIDTIYLDIEERYGFCNFFANEIDLLTKQRSVSKVDNKLSKILNGLK